MILFLLQLAAHAGGIHTGIPVTGIDGLQPPAFQGSTFGWTADVEGGFVRVFVGATEAEAKDWVTRMVVAMERYRPAPNPDHLTHSAADEAWGDGVGLLVTRNGNVGIMVRNNGQASLWASRLEQSIVDLDVPWPRAPTLVQAGDLWTVEAEEHAQHIAFVGGHLAPQNGLVFLQPPDVLVGWDGWGRSARWERVPTED